MGLSESDGLSIVLGLQQGMLYKSMTTQADSTIWQDVYYAPMPKWKDRLHQGNDSGWGNGYPV
nr:type II toxin-antitoxin system MqsR family toxin [Sulfuriferula thiophila]